MSKKSLPDLKELETFSQKLVSTGGYAAPGKASHASPRTERATHVTMRVTERLARAIRLAAVEANLSQQTFILQALQAKGVEVLDEDLVDRRKERS